MAAPKTSSPADPQEHQVYLPNGWQWVKISDVYQIDPKNVANDDIDAAFIPMEKVSAGFGGSYSFDVRAWGRSKKGHTHFADGDVAFAKISPCFENRKSMVLSGLPNGIGAGTTELIVLRSPDILPLFTYFMVSDSRFINGGRQTYKGTAGQQRISMDYVKNYEFPLPPLPEQRRIVARIEALFSDLDNGVATLRTTKRLLVLYRQSVLKEAFKNAPKSVPAGEICTHITDGDHNPPPKAPNGIPFIMISNICEHKIDWSNTAFVGEDYFDHIGDKRRPQKGDVLYTVTGSFGIPILIDFEKKFCFQRHIALLRPKKTVLSKYLFYALQSPKVFEQAHKRATGTAQKTVGLGVLRSILLPFHDDTDQQQNIVNEIERKLSQCAQITQTVDAALQKSDSLRQSILKQAFEGRL